MVPRLAELIAQQEGWGIAGDMPTRQNNPGDLEHAPGESHDGTGLVGRFASAAEGWDALVRQLELDANRAMTLQQLIYTYAPPSENNSAAYLNFVCKGLGCTPAVLVSDALQIPGVMEFPDEPS